MYTKKKSILSVLLVSILLLVLYIAVIRDWSKPTFIDRHWIECTVDKINSYSDLSEIYADLVKDGDFFEVGEYDDFSNGIRTSNDYLNFSIVYNEDTYNAIHYISNKDNLEKWLDDEIGEFRPVFNLLSRKYNFKNGSCWISPNIRLRNEYGATVYDDNIIVVIFCEQFTVTIEQYGWGGDKPFEKFFLMFYDLLKDISI